MFQSAMESNEPQTNATRSASPETPVPQQRRAVQKSACLGCRDTKQKCSRGRPCSRCSSQGLTCNYPSTSKRGRKPGSTNKPETVERFLDRLNRSSIRDEVIAALCLQSSEHRGSHGPQLEQSPTIQREVPHRPRAIEQAYCPEDTTNTVDEHVHAPLHIVAATVDTSDIVQWSQTSGSRVGGTSFDPLSRGALPHACGYPIFHGRDRLTSYFEASIAVRSDWEELTLQTPQSTLQINPSVYDPVASRLLDDNDVMHAFDLFFKFRNPFVGLLDPKLHTPQYVRSASFTLFSVICSLGTALSTEPRDRILYPTLAAIADANIRWSMAMNVKSIETVQAFLLFTYWGPAHEKQRDDPYWLRLSHAIQLARELQLGRSHVVQERAMLLEPTDQDLRTLLARNMERTWLYVFIADKSFGITTGRAMCFSWKEIPSDVSGWWQRPGAASHDRMICGIVEMRVVVVKALERRRHGNKDRAEIMGWQEDAFKTLSDIRKQRCGEPGSSSVSFIPVLAFYIDYSLLLVNTHAAGDLISLGQEQGPLDLNMISQQSAEIAIRLLDLVLSDTMLVDLMSGFHNCQLVMICHGVTEILNTIKRGARPDLIQIASAKVHAISRHLRDIASMLPNSSWAHIYADISQVLVEKLNYMPLLQHQTIFNDDCANFVPDDHLHTDWWSSVGGGSLDLMDWVNMDALGGVEGAIE